MKNILIIILVITILWMIYLFVKTLKTSASTGSFQKKLAERKLKKAQAKIIINKPKEVLQYI